MRRTQGISPSGTCNRTKKGNCGICSCHPTSDTNPAEQRPISLRYAAKAFRAVSAQQWSKDFDPIPTSYRYWLATCSKAHSPNHCTKTLPTRSVWTCPIQIRQSRTPKRSIKVVHASNATVRSGSGCSERMSTAAAYAASICAWAICRPDWRPLTSNGTPSGGQTSNRTACVCARSTTSSLTSAPLLWNPHRSKWCSASTPCRADGE